MEDAQKISKEVLALVAAFLPSSPSTPLPSPKHRQVYQYVLRILSSHLASSLIISNEEHISEVIQKKLIREKDAQIAATFAEKYIKFSKKSVYKNKWAILYLLNSLSHVKKQPSTTSFSFLDNALDSLNLLEIRKEETQKEKEEKETNSKYSKHSKKPPDWLNESTLIHDLLFVLQGISGKYIDWDETDQSFKLNDSFGASEGVAMLVATLAEVGNLFTRVHKYQQQFQQSQLLGTPSLLITQKIGKDQGTSASTGLVHQSFCSAISDELRSYYRVLAVIQSNVESQLISLTKLLLWIQEPLHKLKTLATLINATSSLKGGGLISVLVSYTHTGNQYTNQFIHQLLHKVCAPLFEMIRLWIYEGQLTDPHNEFFIHSDVNVSVENLWSNKYSLRTSLIPSFISSQMAHKILLIGKSINFIREACKDNQWTMDKQSFAKYQNAFQYSHREELYGLVDEASQSVSKRLLDMLFNKYNLFEHTQAIKRYLLLGQGDFLEYLMDLLWSQLSAPASTLFRHNLMGILDTSIRGSNAQFDSQDIQNRLDIRLLEASGHSTGWDIFYLEYHVSSPISTIFSPSVMRNYLTVFNFLWRIKRVERALSNAWKYQANSMRSIPSVVREVMGTVQKHQTTRNQMLHFIYNLQYYIMFEVLEFSWEELVKAMKFKAQDLDEIIAAHDKYLNYIMEKLFLTNDPLLKDLRNILENILKFCQVHEELYKVIDEEGRSRIEETYSKYSRTKGLEDGEEEENTREFSLPHDLEIQLQNIAKQYSLLLKTFTNSLGKQTDENLRFLTFRLDFNEYYEKQEHKALPKLLDSFVMDDLKS